jgi:hypothetical protein
MEEGDLIPLPPVAPAAIPLVEEVVAVWRVHKEPDPRNPPRYPTARYRFDAPASEYPVTYGNIDRLACFAEVYGDRGQILGDQATRSLSQLIARRPLRLVALDEAEVFLALGLDARVNTTKRYDRTQSWSLALHKWFPAADGIRFSGRKAGKALNYCLFLDRCAADLDLYSQGQLQDLRAIVLAAAARYRLKVEIAWRT